MYFYIILPLFQKVNPVVDFGITLCAGGFVTMPKFTTGSSANTRYQILDT